MIDSTHKKETDSTPDQDDLPLEELLSSVEASDQDDRPLDALVSSNPLGQGASDPGTPPGNMETAGDPDQLDKPLEELLESNAAEATVEDLDPSSSVKRLTDMVASTSAADVKRGTRSAPPPASPLSEPAQISAPPQLSTPPQQSSSKGLLLVVGGAALLAVIAAAAMLLTKTENTQEDEQLSALKAQIDDIEKQRTSPVTPEPQATKADTPPSEETVSAEQEDSPIASDPSAEKQVEEEDPEEPPTTAGYASRKPKRAVKKHQPPRKSSASNPVKTTSKPDDSPKTEPKKESQNIDDYLLGGSADKEAKKPEAPSAPEKNSSLPTKPTKAQVKAAMQKVTAKASKCSKYSTETVKVKLVVGGNGRVQSAAAQGAAAGTTAGKCVEMLARTAKFPEFSGPNLTLVYPIVLK